MAHPPVAASVEDGQGVDGGGIHSDGESNVGSARRGRLDIGVDVPGQRHQFIGKALTGGNGGERQAWVQAGHQPHGEIKEFAPVAGGGRLLAERDCHPDALELFDEGVGLKPLEYLRYRDRVAIEEVS